MSRPWEPQEELDLSAGHVVWETTKREFARSVQLALKNPDKGIHRQAAIEWAQVMVTLKDYYSENIW